MRLIINADDFGITEPVSDAIIACHQAGSVTSTTLMTNMPAAGYAAEKAQGLSGLGVGLHFNLTLGKPLSVGGAALAEKEGEFASRYRLLAKLARQRSLKPCVREELEAQWYKAVELGVQPTHIDSHQHVHVSPTVFDVVAEFALEKNVAVRIPWAWSGKANRGCKRRLKNALLQRANLRNHRCWEARGLKTNSGFGSVFDLVGTGEAVNIELYQRLLAGWQNHPQEGVVELMVHPEICDPQLFGLVGITDFGERDYQLLSDRAVCQLLFAEYELCDYEVLS